MEQDPNLPQEQPIGAEWNWPGARWWRVDLHAHSPASHDFGSETDRADPDWVAWIAAARDAGLDAIAITDHNTADGISAPSGRCLWCGSQSDSLSRCGDHGQ